uniref:Uncharacterized protein n=1 Tax=Anguilla anguilla TaxID=7936 RepID=A0A0E9VM87_ANGAN
MELRYLVVCIKR